MAKRRVALEECKHRARYALEDGFVILVIREVLLPVSRIPLTTQHYDLTDTRYFSEGQPMEFYWTFKENKIYRFEVKGANWPSPPSSLHQFAVGNGTYLGSSEPALGSASVGVV